MNFMHNFKVTQHFYPCMQASKVKLYIRERVVQHSLIAICVILSTRKVLRLNELGILSIAVDFLLTINYASTVKMFSVACPLLPFLSYQIISQPFTGSYSCLQL